MILARFEESASERAVFVIAQEEVGRYEDEFSTAAGLPVSVHVYSNFPFCVAVQEPEIAPHKPFYDFTTPTYK